MTCYDDGTGGPAPQRETELPPRVNWWASAWIMVVLLAMVGLLLLAGCGPLHGPAGARIGPAPERGLSTIGESASATAGELATVCTSTTVIREEVAAMVPSVREAAKAAPAPAARIAQGHKVIYDAASQAETAATTAQAQVETISASATQAQKELDFLRAEHAKELEARDKRIAELEEADSQWTRWVRIGALALGGLLVAAGVGMMFLLRGAVTIPLAVMATGGALIGLSAIMAWLAWIIGGLALVGLIVALAWVARRKEQARAATSDALDGAIGFAEQLKAGATVEQAKAWAKANLPKSTRDLTWERLPHEVKK